MVEIRARLDGDDLERTVTGREGLRALAFANNHAALDRAAIDDLHRASVGAG